MKPSRLRSACLSRPRCPSRQSPTTSPRPGCSPPSDAATHPTEASSQADALSISISSFECEGLPQKVLDRAAAGLRAAVSPVSAAAAASASASGCGATPPPPPPPLPLAALPAAAGAAFFAAVRSLADVEQYETVDASGASVRRFAVVREDVAVEVEAEKKPAAAAAKAAATAPAKKPLSLPPRAPFLPRRKLDISPAEAEMRFLERRFGSSLSILEEEAEEEGEEADEGGTKEKEEESRQRQQQNRRRRFRVSGFVPSDPSWRSGPVSLLGTIDPSRYPAPGSFSLLAEVDESDGERRGEEEGGGGGGGAASGSVAAARLTLALRRAAKAAAAAADSSASGAAGGGVGGGEILRSLVRLADSRGGELSAAPAFSLSDDDDDDGDEAESDDEDDRSSSGSSGSGSSGTDSSNTDSESESEDEAAEVARAPPGSPSAAASGGARFALSLASLSLDGVEALSPAALALEISCLRCCASAVLPAVTLSSSASSASSSLSPLRECGTCRAPQSLSLQPRVAHASSSVVAVARCLGCVPAGVALPLSSFGAQCERCSRVAALRGAAAAAAGAPTSSSALFALRRPCPSCHASLAVLFEECSFERMADAGLKGGGRGGGGSGGGTGTETRRKKKRGGAGAAGDDDDGDDGSSKANKKAGGAPLPRNGACDHYPHSKRAMRFPCCHRVFACDVCHELSAAADPRHPPEVASVATRMVCGFCSKEQPFEKKGEAAVCRRCGRHLAGSARHGSHGAATRHWEGGEGCRDRSRLDRRDSKKHGGSRLKTTSRKAFRVGAEAAARKRKKKKKKRGEKK